ncbi:hypothetical protein GTP44_26760 [Duganella sp. FT50W]|uniref:Uncharacterized protein n=1 Tax=Duganella lactea TaxID=2692173 RepID=A0A6L8MTV9_9BURK|nr:hypothetical protein [Duganella lactea]MYM85515.1 hypothetical protein [Duganella lactea]
MTVPILDFSRAEVVINELFDPDEYVRTEFRTRFSGQAVAFAEAISPAFARFPQFSDDGQHCVQTALVCGFVHGILDDLVTSMKLLLTGKLTASGNLLRQAIEGVCMAVMCAYQGTLSIGDKECNYWKMVEEQAKEAEGNFAARQFVKNFERLGLNMEGAEQLKSTIAMYHQHSHAGVVAMAYRMELGPNGVIYIGGHFDEAKIDGYLAELEQRIGVAKLTVQLIDFLWPSIRAVGGNSVG